MNPPDLNDLVAIIAAADDAGLAMFGSIGAMIIASLALIGAMVLLAIGINHTEEEKPIRRRWYTVSLGMVLIAFMLYGWGTAWNRDRAENRAMAAATLCPRIVPDLPRLTMPQYQSILGLCRRDERVLASPVLDAACMGVLQGRTTPFTPFFLRQVEEVCGRTAVETFVLNQGHAAAPGTTAGVTYPSSVKLATGASSD